MIMAMVTRNRIPDHLTVKGWSIYELASRAGMSYPQLYRLVKAEQIPAGTTLGTLKKVAQALEVSIAELEKEEDDGK